MITFLMLSLLLLFSYSLILIYIHLHNLSVLQHYGVRCSLYNTYSVGVYILISLAQQFISESHRQFYFS